MSKNFGSTTKVFIVLVKGNKDLNDLCRDQLYNATNQVLQETWIDDNYLSEYFIQIGPLTVEMRH